jgi:hypothetical protein
MAWLDPAIFTPATLENVTTLRLGEDVMVEGHVHRAG